ncbi:MAG: DUF4445 domain-containing protein [Oscillospiraceae bacterium]|nr:DUF4445 domain-containing protein [Oscillospiraceae bacterium]
MDHFRVTFLPQKLTVSVPAGTTLLQAQIDAGLRPDAPCAGRGTCGKCLVTVNGQEILSCQTAVDRDMTVHTKTADHLTILTEGVTAAVIPDGIDNYVLACDIGTTTVVVYLLDGRTGGLLARSSAMNPQSQFGADVISRIQHTLRGGAEELSSAIRDTLHTLCADAAARAGIDPAAISRAAIVGNTAMHHLLLGIDPKPLVTPPYMPRVREALELGCARILPNIAGFVGGDTVGCMTATRFDQKEELTLLIDIGTNGEMVLGDRHRRVACSTAAGPAFEGAKISCGTRGAPGAVDHVTLKDGQLSYTVIGGGEPKGLCGSGLLDLVAALLDLGIIDESGRMEEKTFTLCPNVTLTQKDVREVQLAKAAIRAGIELLCAHLGSKPEGIQAVLLAGAFGSYMTPASACRLGMIPPVLLERIQSIGNAAGEGAKLCALSEAEFTYSQSLAESTEFLELASLAQFQDCYVDALEFEEETI